MVNKLTNTVKPLDEVDKINEIIDALDDINVAIDNSTITKNALDQLQTVAVKDNRSGNAIKTWTGTKAQYDAIATKDANTLYFCTDSGEIYLGSVLISNKTNGKDIGDVIFSLTPKIDAGLHLLDGALIQGSGIYSAFVTYIAGLVNTYPDLFITEASWQTSVTNYGVCGKFVYDSVNNTVRLPKVTGILEGTTDVTALGDLVEAGLPNITGGCFIEAVHDSFYGALYDNGGSSGWMGNNQNTSNGNIAFDASRSSAIYGNSTTVQPQTIKAFYYIVIATSAKTDIQVDIDEIATDLNNKLDTDLTNVSASQSAKNEIVSWGMPDFNNGITNTSLSFTAPSKGWYYYTKSIGGNATLNLTVNSIAIGIARPWGAAYDVAYTGCLPLNKNDVVVFSGSNYDSTRDSFKFFPMKGAN